MALFLCFVVVLYGLNPAATAVVNRSIAPAAHLSSTIRGAFPVQFSVDEIVVGDGGALVVSSLDVHYVGTYNPFGVLTQVGPVARATATATVDLFGYRTALDLANITVVRLADGWTVSFQTVVFDGVYPMRVVLMVPDDLSAAGASPRVDVAIGDHITARVDMSGAHVTYADRTLVDLRLVDGQSFVLNVADVLSAAGAWRVGSDVFAVSDVSAALFGDAASKAPPRLFGALEVAWGTDVKVTLDPPAVDVAFSPAGVLSGTILGSNVHRDPTTTDGGIVFAPPIATPLGGLQSIGDYVASTLTIVLGKENIVLSTADASVHYGPITFAVTEERASVTVAGGHFRDFTCVRLEGHVEFDTPHVVVVDRLSAREGLDGAMRSVDGHGTYDIATRTLKLSFDVEINT